MLLFYKKICKIDIKMNISLNFDIETSLPDVKTLITNFWKFQNVSKFYLCTGQWIIMRHMGILGERRLKGTTKAFDYFVPNWNLNFVVINYK